MRLDKFVSGITEESNSRPIKTAKQIQPGDRVIIMTMRMSEAKKNKNSNKVFMIDAICDSVKEIQISSPSLQGHKNILVPLVNDVNTKTYVNTRHEWMSQWNNSTKIFGVKLKPWNTSNEYTYSRAQNTIALKTALDASGQPKRQTYSKLN